MAAFSLVRSGAVLLMACLAGAATPPAPPPANTPAPGTQAAPPSTAPAAATGRGRGRGQGRGPTGPTHLADLRIRDICILADPATHTYYMVGPSGRGVREYSSKDLVTWEGPTQVFNAPNDVWGDLRVTDIWAPEIHKYKDKYYLFLTFNTNTPMAEQNPPGKPALSQRPLVHRGSTTLVADTPTGPFKAMQNQPVPPADLMTLDGTLWVEEGQPYMVFAHEWVQIAAGTIEAVKLKEDLSAAADKPFVLFKSTDAPWAKTQPEGGTVTDGPYLYTSKSGKLFMVWSSFDGQGRYNVGLAISPSGKLAGPWQHQPEALFVENGGHPMLFKTFEGQLMLLFHAPNNNPASRPRLLEVEDTGDTLRVTKEFTGK